MEIGRPRDKAVAGGRHRGLLFSAVDRFDEVRTMTYVQLKNDLGTGRPKLYMQLVKCGVLWHWPYGIDYHSEGDIPGSKILINNTLYGTYVMSRKTISVPLLWRATTPLCGCPAIFTSLRSTKRT